MDVDVLARRVVFPELVLWSCDEAKAQRRAAAGFGGFCVYGGDEATVKRLTGELRARTFMADYEDGVGQQVKGGTEFPTNLAVGATGSEDAAYRKGLATARESREVGVNLVLAPVLDVQTRPDNPIVNTRSFGADPDLVGRLGAAYARGLREGRARSCGKHFPGHGDASVDSHVALPRIPRPEVRPFQRALPALDSVMIGHLLVDALDPDRPATISPAIVTTVLRGTLGFRGPVLSDALMMKALAAYGTEEDIAVGALAAGVDGVLYPTDSEAVARAIAEAVRSGRLKEARLRDAAERLDGLVGPAEAVPAGGRKEHEAWAREIAEASIHVKGSFAPGTPGRVVTVKDDTSWADERVFTEAAGEASTGPTVVAVYSRIRAFRGMVGLPEDLRAKALAAKPDVVVLFGNPYNESAFDGVPVVYAWGDSPSSQRAAARVIRGEIEPRGTDPR